MNGLNLDVIFPVLHGPYGEDGTVRGCWSFERAVRRRGVLASRRMDKAIMSSSSPRTVCRSRVRVVMPTSATRIPRPLDLLETTRLPDVRQTGESRSMRRHLEGKTRDGSRGAGPGRSYDRRSWSSRVPEAREIECAVLGNDTPEASWPSK